MEEQIPEISFTPDQLRDGNPDAWEKAYSVFFELAFNVLKGRYPLSHHDLEDLAQETIITLIDKFVEQAEDVASLSKMVITIAKNKAKDLLRLRNAQKHGGGAVESLEGQPEGTQFKSEAADPEMEAERAEKALLLGVAVKKLPRNLAEVVEDCYFLSLAHKEIAEKRGLKIGSIGVYINRALVKLHKILAVEDLL